MSSDGAVDVRSGARPSPWRWTAAIVLVLIVLGTLGIGFQATVANTRTFSAPSFGSDYRVSLHQFECLQAIVRHDVQKGASVHLGGSPAEAQALYEYVTPWAVPSSEHDAQYRLRLHLTGGSCAGRSITVSAG